MSVTPARFISTTSFALMSRQSWAARCTLCAPSRAVTDGKDVAMRLSEGLFAAWSAASLYVAYLPCESSVRGSTSHFACQFHTQKDLAALTRRGQVFRRLELLLDDPDLDLGMDIRVQADRHAVDSRR